MAEPRKKILGSASKTPGVSLGAPSQSRDRVRFLQGLTKIVEDFKDKSDAACAVMAVNPHGRHPKTGQPIAEIAANLHAHYEGAAEAIRKAMELTNLCWPEEG